MKFLRSRHLIALATVLTTGALLFITFSPSQAQFSSPDNLAPQVYEKLPDFPLENQYRRRDKKEIATNSTLIKRLIQYHVNQKGRSPLFRLDWKITIAEYLGLNGYMQPSGYPGNRFLKSNPMEADQAAIQKLNRAERNQLIQALVDVFTATTATEPSATIPSTTPTSQPAATPKSQPATTPQYGQSVPPLRESGAASDLLGTPSPNPQNHSSPNQPPQRKRPTGDAQLLLP